MNLRHHSNHYKKDWKGCRMRLSVNVLAAMLKDLKESPNCNIVEHDRRYLYMCSECRRILCFECTHNCDCTKRK
jgi:hypothetical protein